MRGSQQSILGAILFHPLSLLIVGGSALLAWLFDFWYIVLLGLAVEVFLISSWSQNEGFKRKIEASMLVSRLTEFNQKCDGAMASVWERSWGRRSDDSPVAQAFRAKDAIWRSFLSAQSDVQLLMEEIVELALKSATGFVELYRAKKALATGLEDGGVNEAMRELSRLKARMADARDPVARDEYQKAVTYKEEEIAGYGQNMARVEALSARMDKIVAALQSIRGKMAGMTSFELQDYDNEVSLLRAEAVSLESAMKEMSSVKSR